MRFLSGFVFSHSGLEYPYPLLTHMGSPVQVGAHCPFPRPAPSSVSSCIFRPGECPLSSPFSFQNLEKQMRQLAVIPPMLYDADQQRIKFINMNGLMDDPMKVYKDRQVMNMWSEQEKETFREK